MIDHEPFYRPALTILLVSLLLWAMLIGATRWAVARNEADSVVIHPCALVVTRDGSVCR